MRRQAGNRQYSREESPALSAAVDEGLVRAAFRLAHKIPLVPILITALSTDQGR